MSSKNLRAHKHHQTTPRMFENLGTTVVAVVSSILLVGLIGVAISSRKLPETTFIEPRQVPGAVSEIAPDNTGNTVVGEKTNGLLIVHDVGGTVNFQPTKSTSAPMVAPENPRVGRLQNARKKLNTRYNGERYDSVPR